MRKISVSILGVALLLSSLVSNCGDNDNGPPPPPLGWLNGSYHATSYWHGNTVVFGSMTFNGKGNGTFDQILKSQGTPESGSFTYTVETSGKVTLNTDQQGDRVIGVVSGDSSFVTFIGSYPAGQDNELITLIKQASGMSNASLNGTYYGTSYGHGNTVVFALLTFDGQGGGTYQHLINSSGSLETGAFTYDVDASGEVSIDAGEQGDQVIGAVSSDGMIVTFVGFYPGQDNERMILIKQSSGMSNARLNGAYYGTEYMHGNTVLFVSLTFDGNGAGTVELLVNSSGSLDKGSLTYDIDESGQVDVFTDNGVPGYQVKGIVSSDGSIASFIGLYPDEDNSVTVLTKRK